MPPDPLASAASPAHLRFAQNTELASPPDQKHLPTPLLQIFQICFLYAYELLLLFYRVIQVFTMYTHIFIIFRTIVMISTLSAQVRFSQTNVGDVQYCHQGLSSVFDLLLIFLCSLFSNP